LNNVERTIAKLDDQKKLSNAQLMSVTDAKEAMRLHNEVIELAKQLNHAEERWCVLQEQLGEMD
jgi:ATP-binding cassette, subfamily F, member 3